MSGIAGADPPRLLPDGMLPCKAPKRQHILHFHQHLDDPDTEAHIRRSLVVAMQRLSRKTNLYPKTFTLKDVMVIDNSRVGAGGFADIYKGRFKDQFVCLKMIRAFKSSQVEYIVKVSFTLSTLRFGILTILRYSSKSHAKPFFGDSYHIPTSCHSMGSITLTPKHALYLPG